MRAERLLASSVGRRASFLLAKHLLVAGEIERQQDVRNRAADVARQAQRRADDIAWFWKIAMERLEEYGEFRYNGVAYRSVDEVSQAPGSYRGTKPEATS